VQSQPLMIIGAPRSGTTFLCHVLNQHPLVHLTNENRIFAFLKDMIEVRSARADLIGREFRDQFVAFIHRTGGEWVERFYREELRITTPIWGDKHPPYADPAVLSGRRGSLERQPRSGSCLQLISTCLPATKFIHIHRDPMQVAHSLVRKGWTGSIDDGVRVWEQYVTEIVAFFGTLPSDRHLTLAYGDMLEQPETAAAAIGCFLRLSEWGPIEAFLHAQRQRPTPFSDPVTDLSDPYRVRAARHANRKAAALATDAAQRLGYAASSASG
jgi:Sulfotransferase family